MDEPQVQYTVREMLDRMDRKIDALSNDVQTLKTSAVSAIALQAQAAALERGDFSPSHRRAILELINDTEDDRQTTRWSRREQVMAIATGSVTAISLVLSIVIALHTGAA